MPVTIAFTDLVASVIKVEGPSMSPTFNPSAASPSPDGGGKRSSSSRSAPSKEGTEAASASGRELAATNSDWIVVEKISYKWNHKYQRGDVVVLW